MVKIIPMLTRRSDLTFEQFIEHWQQRHPAYVTKLPGLRRYVQNPAHPHKDRIWLCDGVAELWFDDVRAVKLAFESAAAGPMREDEQRFIRRQEWLLCDEHAMVEEQETTG
ncbi:MAG: EthD family reductase [Chloroflexota bacterium]